MGGSILTATCPDENALVAFAMGQLDPQSLAGVVTHVDGCPDCAAMVADAVEAVAPVSPSVATRFSPCDPTPAMVAAGPLPRGTMLGRYVVLGLLGSGGLGHVYTAYDPELDRRVAIKLLRSAAGGRPNMATARWLLREAQAMAKLSHRHVVPVHDVGTWHDEVFIAMELIPGGTLKAWLAASDRPWTEVRDVMVDAGRGLQAAHDAGLVHRDFKPTNVLVDGRGGVFVMDFGLARAVDDVEPYATDPLEAGAEQLLDEDLTETGAVVGTPAYMAPEQLRGTAVGARADQFAFCVALHEALFGQRPFTAATVRELDAAIAAGPAPNSAATVPTWLGRAIRRGLAYDADDRFASMEELLDALTRDRRSRRRQWFAIGGAALLSAVVASGVVLAIQPEVTPQHRQQVETTVAAAREAAARACFLYPPEQDPESSTAYAHVLALESTEGPAAALAQAEAQQLREDLAGQLVQLGDAYWDREGGAAFASDYYAAAVIFDPDRAQARARVRMTPGQLGALEQRASAMSFSSAELAAADVLTVLAEPDERSREADVADWVARDDVPVATQAQLRRLYPALGPDGEGDRDPVPQVATAEPITRQVAVPEAVTPAPSPRSAGPSEQKDHHDPGPAAPPAPRDPKAAKAEVARGRTASKRGDLDQAAVHFHRALEHDSRSAAALSGLGVVQFEQGHFSTSVTYGERAVRLAPNNAEYHRSLADAYVRVFRYGDARRHYGRAHELGHPGAAKRLAELDDRTGAG